MRGTQRDFMRNLYKRLGGDRDQVVAAYAAAERSGNVARARNSRGINADEYARRLWNDGVLLGWLNDHQAR